MRIRKRVGLDLGENLKYQGNVFRVFNPKEPNYYSYDVQAYIKGRGEDLTSYSNYGVVPKRQILADKALLRYDRPHDVLDDEVKCLYDIAGDWLEKEFGNYLCDSVVYSSDHVIDWLPDDTSPGYPWTLKYPYKSDFWASDDFSFYSKYWNALATDEPIQSFCSVVIKEEIKPIFDINVNQKVRTIAAMDCVHVLCHARFTLHQNERLIKTHCKHSSALGLDMFDLGWHMLNHKMSCFGNKPCTMELDGKKFDGRFAEYCFKIIRKFRWKMLAPRFRTLENKIRLRNIYKQLTFAPLVNVNGDVYSRHVGNPSGQACTTPDNTFKNFMDMVVLWHLIMPKEYHTYDQFKKFIVMCICGDDINKSVDPSIHDIYNVAAIRRVMSRIGMEYHFASDEYRHNYECAFLGHGFNLLEVPGLRRSFYFPVIDCEKMRTNMLIDNKDNTPAGVIVRACGLRNETFACESCREWFNGLISFLRVKYGDDSSSAVQSAWKNYLTDRELWKVYSGF